MFAFIVPISGVNDVKAGPFNCAEILNVVASTISLI